MVLFQKMKKLQKIEIKDIPVHKLLKKKKKKIETNKQNRLIRFKKLF